jgi:hypothetical protein
MRADMPLIAINVVAMALSITSFAYSIWISSRFFSRTRMAISSVLALTKSASAWARAERRSGSRS